MSYELVAKSYMEGEGMFPRNSIQIGDLIRRSDTGEVFMVESDDFVREFYGDNIWSDNLWRWEGDFRAAPDLAFTEQELDWIESLPARWDW